MAFFSLPEHAAEHAALMELLRNLSFGETLSYDDASETIGRDVRHSARTSLLAAIRKLELEDGTRRFGSVYRIGIKRLSEGEVHVLGKAARNRARNTVRRAYRRLDGTKANDPVAAEHIRIEKAHLGAIALAMKESHHKQVAEITRANGGEPPAAVLLALFAK
jgi:hypothetical protein